MKIVLRESDSPSQAGSELFIITRCLSNIFLPSLLGAILLFLPLYQGFTTSNLLLLPSDDSLKLIHGLCIGCTMPLVCEIVFDSLFSDKKYTSAGNKVNIFH